MPDPEETPEQKAAREAAEEAAAQEAADAAAAAAEDPDLEGLDDKALAKIRKVNAEAANLRKRAKAAEDALEERRLAELSEQERKDEEAKAAAKRAETAEDRANRLEVALAKGLTPDQASRLKGSTVEELSADADVLLAQFQPVDGEDDDETPAPRTRPRELRPGTKRTATAEDESPDALADRVPRGLRL